MNVHKNKDLLKKIREEKKLQNELKEESIICFFEYDPKTHNYIVRDLGTRCESKSKEEINGVENKIKDLKNKPEGKRSLLTYLKKINGVGKCNQVEYGNKEFYFIHCVKIKSPKVQKSKSGVR